MKHLIRRLSRVADLASEFSIRRSTSSSSLRIRRGHHRPHMQPPWSICQARRVHTVPAGHVPVYVGEEMERFVVSAELLNHPVFVGLLNRSAQEYGYAQKGVLHIPCHVIVFERVVETLQSGYNEPGVMQELVASLISSDELILGTTELVCAASRTFHGARYWNLVGFVSRRTDFKRPQGQVVILNHYVV
ncbi:hypothetical protein Bca101_095080 [Brassica carinata]